MPTDQGDAPRDASGVFAIYPDDGIPPESRNWTWSEHAMQVPNRFDSAPTTIVHNVAKPTVTVFRPEPAIATGASIIIAPGGAFYLLMMEHEGFDVARPLTALGMTVFVLKYRLAHTPETEAGMTRFYDEMGARLPKVDLAETFPPVGTPEMEQARVWAERDGQQALRWVRQNADQFDIDPDRIGIAGFSAGGGVALAAASEYDEESRPDFAAGIYPAYRRGLTVPSDVPPLFLAAADGDTLVLPGSTAALYQAWRNAGNQAELHIFSGGQHGFGMRRQDPQTWQWFDLFVNWLRAQALVN